MDLRRAHIYKAVTFAKIFPLGALKFYRISSLSVAVVTGVLAAVRIAYLDQLPSQNFFLGISLIASSLGFSVLFFEIYNYYYLRYPKITQTDNIADFLNFSSAKILTEAQSVAQSLGEEKVSTQSLIVALLNDVSVEEVLMRMPELAQARKDISQTLFGKNPFSSLPDFSSEVEATIGAANNIRTARNGDKISPLDILAALFDTDKQFKTILLKYNIEKQDLTEIANWYEHIWNYRQRRRKFWSYENLLRHSPVGASWVYGFAPYLTRFSTNLTEKYKYSRIENRLVGRKREMDQIEEILVRSGKNNVLLVGPAGVGKDRLINDLADMIAQGESLSPLNYKNVLQLNVGAIAGSVKTSQELQNVFLEVFSDAVKAGNVILVLEDIHNFIGGGEGVGAIDLSSLLAPYLNSAHLQVVATTDPASYHRHIESRSDFASLFERVDIQEPTAEQTIRILEEIVPATEYRSGVFVTYEAIKSIIDSADRFITTEPFPEKAVDLLSEVIAHVLAHKSNRVVTSADVQEAVTQKTGVPQGAASGSERDKLLKFEELMHKELVGQERAVEVVASTLRRLRAGLGKKGKPAGVFLFLGPTGVGKTLTAKILARTYYGSEDRMIRFDMSEYQEIDSIDRFIGNATTNESGQFASQVRDNPFSLILLDEIEKANRNILNLFLQVFDEGRLTDVFGRKVSFEQNIIIATSNAGADAIRDMVNKGVDPADRKEEINDLLIQGRFFTPELLNRFDEVVVFHPLSQDQIKNIAQIMLDALVKKMEAQGYLFKPGADLIDYLAEVGFDPQFGARPMQRAIRDKIESAIANGILDGHIRKGEEFSIGRSELM